MADLQSTLQTHRQAADALLATARGIPAARWKQPRAKGKWSPAEVTEHLALAYEVNRGILHGSAPGGALPSLLRPLLRTYVLRPILLTGRFFPGSRSPKIFRPTGVPTSQEVLVDRLQGAVQAFEKYVTGAQGTHIDHPFFGRLSLADFVQLQTIHLRHHHKQLQVVVT